MKKVKKAVIPAAGLGTRVLPATKSMPKEMIPIVDKPSIQYIVEEAVASGIEDILIITNKGKGIMEDHFDRSFELEQRLLNSGKTEVCQSIIDLSNLANISYIRQKETKGLGHAVYCAKSFVGDEPFIVMYGDDVILSETPVTKQLVDAYDKNEVGVVGIKEVSPEQILSYSSLKVENIKDNLFKITDMIEKPTPDKVLSLYSILGRCLLPSSIFQILENTAPGAGGEIQLTDAMYTLCKKEGLLGVDYYGKRYDMGNKLGIIQANIDVGLKHPETKDGLIQYLKELAASL